MKLALTITSCALALAAETAPNQFSNLKLGLFTHYTYAGGDYRWGWTYQSSAFCRPVPDLDTLANSFDANAFAETAAGMKAQYVMFTAFHARINLLYPSAFWNKALPGHTATRDVIRELARALHARGIKLALYFHPVDGMDLSPDEQKRTRWTEYAAGEDVRPWNDLMNELIADFGRRYGGQIDGYWLDGAPAPPKFDGPRFRATIRKYSPGAVVWVNYGVPTEKFPNNTKIFPGLSDLATNENFGGKIGGTYDTDRWITCQNQVTVVMGGEWWAKCGKVTQTAEKMLRYTVRLAGTREQRNGGIAWAAGPYASNHWETGVREALAGLGRLLAPVQESVFNTVPSTAYVTHAGALQNGTWGVATDSLDGRFAFLHVLNPPEGRAPLRLPTPADGREFRAATLLPGGKPVKLTPQRDGYSLALPPGESWSATDTVIRLEVRRAAH